MYRFTLFVSKLSKSYLLTSVMYSMQCRYTFTESILPTMETEDIIKLPASSNSEHGDNEDTCESDPEAVNSEYLHLNSGVEKEIHGEDTGAIKSVLDENMDAMMEDDFEKGPNSNTVADVERVVSVSSAHNGNGFLSVQSQISVSNFKKNETLSSKREVDAICILFL